MGGRSFKRHGKTVWPGLNEIEPRHVAKVGRNQPCPCGSGKKYKDCHESEGTAYLSKLAQEQDRVRIREQRALMKEAGVPWYRRWLYRG